MGTPELKSREDLEAREDRELAPYAARAARSRGRARPESEHPRRTAFQRDRDRIVHSTAFRRLQYKTQVFIGDEGDHYRTRLTHTLEVAHVARSIARTLALNEDLVETVALAHDLGHAPFGHAGGDALDECMAAHGGFEHNRHALRVVDLLERRPGAEERGLNLTREVRASIAAKREPLEPGRAPLLEAEVVDLADSIAYDAHDVDDGRRAGLIDARDLDERALWRRAGGSVRRLIDLEVSDLADTTAARLRAGGIDSVEAVLARPRGAPLAGFSEPLAAERRELQRFLRERVYRHERVRRDLERACATLRELFQGFVAAPERLPPEWRAWADEMGRERAVCDYVAGMTDRYALEERGRLE